MTRVSIIIPVYNGAATLAAAIDSALAQDFAGGFELIVVNDGSTDTTAEVIEGYRGRVQVVNRANGGLSAARNSGAAIANGEYLAFLDADDLWTVDKLSATIAALDDRPEVVLVYSDAVQVDELGREISPALVAPELARAPSMSDLLERWWPILPSTAVVRRRIFDQVGGFFAPMRSYEDMDFWLRAREVGEFEYLPRALAIYRVTPAAERMVKYEQSYELFVQRVSDRYGSAVRPLIRAIRHAHATALGARGLIAIRRGDLAAARRSFIRALRYEPGNLRNGLRLLRSFLPLPLARALSRHGGVK
ncbi:MAG: glycosyltransferase [Candidatus Binataceae bacterium]|nr:glycosyltransferase [Candidatus Binataceae bacterium]